MKVSDLDRDKENINAQQWMALCLPSENPTTSSQWRKQAGIGNQRQREFSSYHAFLLLVRARLDEICALLNEPKPRVKQIDCFVLEAIGDRWLRAIRGGNHGRQIVSLLAGDEFEIESIGEVLAQMGVGKSPHTQRKYLKGLGLDPSLKKRRRITAFQLRTLQISFLLKQK